MQQPFDEEVIEQVAVDAERDSIDLKKVNSCSDIWARSSGGRLEA